MPVSGKPDFIVIGKLTRPHGIHGEIFLEILTDFPERLKPGGHVFTGDHYAPQVINSLRSHKNGFIVALDGYHNPESVGKLRNQLVFVQSKNLPPLPEGEYYHHEILGLRIMTSDDQELGQLVQILQTGANDVFVVQTPSKAEILIPNIDEIVRKIDLENGVILIDPIPGLLPD
ncbi:MAG: 16S rRNA processing protein RimM [Chloroflexi bacterium RBG_16_54_18]|nr:MAG: 16S rRNA processing protein RimM [Chloroflexi bacterium RBG_16_54_18]